jgi:nucleoside-diphosphate-sugar epimerase
VYNIVDDEPAPIAEWLPVYSQSLGAPAPPQTGPPHGDLGIHGMLRSRGASNAKAKHQLAWTPRYASWRQGFIAEQA